MILSENQESGQHQNHWSNLAENENDQKASESTQWSYWWWYLGLLFTPFTLVAWHIMELNQSLASIRSWGVFVSFNLVNLISLQNNSINFNSAFILATVTAAYEINKKNIVKPWKLSKNKHKLIYAEMAAKYILYLL